MEILCCRNTRPALKVLVHPLNCAKFGDAVNDESKGVPAKHFTELTQFASQVAVTSYLPDTFT